MANQTVYQDPTKPVIPPHQNKKSIGWITFIAFNISIPILFLITYLWMQNQ